MSPVTHFLLSWTLAERSATTPRERAWITFAGIAPDLDGLGWIVDVANQALGRPESFWFEKFHHNLLHGLPGAGLLLVVAALSGVRQGRALLLLLASFHLHLLCDVVGSRGPSPKDIWSIDYLGPLSHAWNLSWSRQWPLNGWQNFVLSAFLIAGCLVRTVRTGISPASLFSQRIDATVVATLRRRWALWSGSAEQ